MKCDNRCSNPAEYRIHRVGQEPKNVCSAHKYVETHSTDESMFTVQPLTLEGHTASFEKNTPLSGVECNRCSFDLALCACNESVEPPLATQLPLATEYRILLDLLLMGAEADRQYVKEQLAKLEERK